MPHRYFYRQAIGKIDVHQRSYVVGDFRFPPSKLVLLGVPKRGVRADYEPQEHEVKRRQNKISFSAQVSNWFRVGGVVG